ncbi:unnamed protein product [Protopolystoma xenopodis]|uniref:Uncharacterized protein n=1 Tax=Protopolystoma xenopodis TaxID=117903 RepID=A0A448WD79_9PLAT|nr:unnamed protein product [Protopolystoma xenopodis]
MGILNAGASSCKSLTLILGLRPKRWRMYRGLHQPERRINVKWLQYNADQPTPCGEIDLRNSSSCTSIQNESLHIRRQCNEKIECILQDRTTYRVLEKEPTMKKNETLRKMLKDMHGNCEKDG